MANEWRAVLDAARAHEEMIGGFVDIWEARRIEDAVGTSTKAWRKAGYPMPLITIGQPRVRDPITFEVDDD
jgi:hypothetical protein